MNFFDHKDLGNHLLQLCPKVVKHPVYASPGKVNLDVSARGFQNLGVYLSVMSLTAGDNFSTLKHVQNLSDHSNNYTHTLYAL
jgi:hypothetical protein